MFFKILSAAAMFISSLGFSTTKLSKSIDCSRHKIYCAIVKLQPNAEPYAMELSNSIYKYSRQYNTDPLLSVAIAMQESGLRKIHRKQSGLKINTQCHFDCNTSYRPATIITDMGMFQFHVGGIKHWNLDIDRIMSHDVDYTVKKHVQILSTKISECSDLKEKSWVCYHSRTPEKRALYYDLVMRYYNKIK